MVDIAEGAYRREPLGPLPTIAGWAPWPTPGVVPTTGSTMEDAARLAAAGAPEGTVVVAEEQTAGRGRRGRTWESTMYAGLWLSIALRPSAPPEQIGWIPLAIGVAVAQGLREESGLEVRLKWPNDVVLVGDSGLRKVAGLLAERLPDGTVVVGIGINVDHAAQELPPGGTSLRMEGVDCRREAVLVAVLAAVARTYRAFDSGRDVRTAYEALSATLGSRVRVETAGAEQVGRAVALGPAGELVVVDDMGEEHVVSAGDVIHLRGEP